MSSDPNGCLITFIQDVTVVVAQQPRLTLLRNPRVLQSARALRKRKRVKIYLVEKHGQEEKRCLPKQLLPPERGKKDNTRTAEGVMNNSHRAVRNPGCVPSRRSRSSSSSHLPTLRLGCRFKALSGFLRPQLSRNRSTLFRVFWLFFYRCGFLCSVALVC